MQSVKRYSASEINKLKSQSGNVWQPESYDHIIRNELELFNTLSYVVNNPVKAGLTDNWEKWRATFLAEDIMLF